MLIEEEAQYSLDAGVLDVLSEVYPTLIAVYLHGSTNNIID